MSYQPSTEINPMKTTSISFKTAQVDGFKIFYREAGDPQAPAVLLLHGFPTSSHMFRNLIPQLGGDYHLVAPDLPGFGFSDAPDHKKLSVHLRPSSRGHWRLRRTIGLKKFAVYVFDYGAPVGFSARASLSRPHLGADLSKRQRLRRRPERRLGSGPCLLGKSEPKEP